MSKYWDKFPSISKVTLDLKPLYGSGYLQVKPQKGPQRAFISCSGGISGKPQREQDFPLVFYGGAR